MIFKILHRIISYSNKRYLFGKLNVKNAKIHPSLIFYSNHEFEIHKNAQFIEIQKNVKLTNFVNLVVGENAILKIGNNTFINRYTSIVSLDKIEIGENCLIGENVKIYDNNHKIEINEDLKITSHKEFSKDSVKIGNNCWLASNVTILKGVTIGDNCIIGAGCIIYKDVPENTTIINNQDLKIK